jgi:hypothetical protein
MQSVRAQVRASENGRLRFQLRGKRDRPDTAPHLSKERAMRPILLLLALAGCVDAGGDPCYSGAPITEPFRSAYAQSCIAAREEDRARARGATVQKCYPGPDGSITCITG